MDLHRNMSSNMLFERGPGFVRDAEGQYSILLI